MADGREVLGWGVFEERADEIILEAKEKRWLTAGMVTEMVDPFGLLRKVGIRLKDRWVHVQLRGNDVLFMSPIASELEELGKACGGQGSEWRKRDYLSELNPDRREMELALGRWMMSCSFDFKEE